MFTRIILIIFLSVSFLILAPIATVIAQNISLGTAVTISVADKKLTSGDIISSIDHGYKRTTTAYDPLFFGIVSENPAVVIEDLTLPNATPVVTSGRAYVRVSTTNGPIKRGDYIATSAVAGVGQKGVENGYVIGKAEEGYTEKNPKKTGIIAVTLQPHFAQLNTNISRNIFSAMRLGASAAILSPLGALRYILSGLIALLSFYFGFRFFGNASRTGVEAIGRNPLASKVILLSVALNVTITISIMFLGVALAYVILVL